MSINHWLGQITPKERSDIANLYWTTTIPNVEIAAAYDIKPTDVTRLAGVGIVKPFACRKCGFLVTVSSRAEAENRFRNVRHDAWLPEASKPDICKDCSKAIRDEQHRRYFAEEAERRYRLATLSSMPYREYLQTPEWARTRADALKRAKYACQTCATKGELHVHHRSYARRGREHPSDLIVLCASCHSIFHQNARLAEGGRAA